MDVTAFQALMARITGEIAGGPLDSSLKAQLNAEHGPGSDTYEALAAVKTAYLGV